MMIRVTNYIFICYFFNTALLPMLCSANMIGQLPSFIVDVLNLKGWESDFGSIWYKDIGETIV